MGIYIEDDYYIALKQSLIDAVAWIESNDLHNSDPYDVVAYKMSLQRHFTGSVLTNLASTDKLIEITENKYKTEFVKITQRTGNRTMNSYAYSIDSAPAPSTIHALWDKFHMFTKLPGRNYSLQNPYEGKCIFYPDSNIEIPYTQITDDRTLWDMSGPTAIIGRQNSAKYTCDILDNEMPSLIGSPMYEIPMKYQFEEYAVLPAPGSVLSIPKSIRDAVSLVMFKKRNHFSNNVLYRDVTVPVFSGIYVTPVIMFYREIRKLRDRAIALTV